ncbi:hypothetical protein K443DRAFT_539144 [Laccaria amethystina LaAM-08-1]|uniref:Secreted protein n=1 Tax=Laccaria amethystina LaAM-08-1 TaxID=1095629 RepID=A0A0C9WRR9_9AGAR|nr:hypothetical protein K443DRAFT_539144 [Laccaria amethystina LaAM-08-1]
MSRFMLPTALSILFCHRSALLPEMANAHRSLCFEINTHHNTTRHSSSFSTPYTESAHPNPRNKIFRERGG